MKFVRLIFKKCHSCLITDEGSRSVNIFCPATLSVFKNAHKLGLQEPDFCVAFLRLLCNDMLCNNWHGTGPSLHISFRQLANDPFHNTRKITVMIGGEGRDYGK